MRTSIVTIVACAALLMVAMNGTADDRLASMQTERAHPAVMRTVVVSAMPAVATQDQSPMPGVYGSTAPLPIVHNLQGMLRHLGYSY